MLFLSAACNCAWSTGKGDRSALRRAAEFAFTTASLISAVVGSAELLRAGLDMDGNLLVSIGKPHRQAFVPRCGIAGRKQKRRALCAPRAGPPFATSPSFKEPELPARVPQERSSAPISH